MNNQELLDAATNLCDVYHRAFAEFHHADRPMPDAATLRILVGDRLEKAVHDSGRVAEAMRQRGIGDLAQLDVVGSIARHLTDFIDPPARLGTPTRVDPAFIRDRLANYPEIRLLFRALSWSLGEAEPVEDGLTIADRALEIMKSAYPNYTTSTEIGRAIGKSPESVRSALSRWKKTAVCPALYESDTSGSRLGYRWKPAP